MKLVGLPILVTALLLVACGDAVDPAPQEERLRAEAERAAPLEAAEKEILNAGVPLPAEGDAEPVALENGAGGADDATADTATNSAF